VSQLGGTVLFVLKIAAAKLTKPVWLIILGAAVLLIPRTDHPKWERIKTDGYDVATLLPLQRDYLCSACRLGVSKTVRIDVDLDDVAAERKSIHDRRAQRQPHSQAAIWAVGLAETAGGPADSWHSSKLP
jgi:hypothetical protein